MRWAVLATVVSAACAGGRPVAERQAAVPTRSEGPSAVRATIQDPFLPPEVARLAGLMPLRALGIEQFRLGRPTADGRGVLIGILDGGLDAGVPGLQRTTTDEPKLVDLRDFSGEGRVALSRIDPPGDSAMVHGRMLRGLGRLRRLAQPPFWVGEFAERPLGRVPAADVNGDGDADDAFSVVVARASDGWVMMTDADGDGSLAGERPLRDFAVARDTFSYGPLTIAVNLEGPADGDPVLDLFFDTSGHGTHVAGIAAGHGLFGIPGFDGAAPGAQLIGLKIANNARGGVSVTGSMYGAMLYAADLAADRGLPLVLNLSYGVGNEREGAAVIDSLVNAFALDHPEVVLVISAGNDGPGLSTVGFPGSAEFAISVCALFPGVFAEPPTPGSRPRADVMGWWSSRGGEVQKPDVCAPGVAFSNVPPWQTGEEVSGGTSMAAPQVSGAAALLQSALLARSSAPARAVDVRAALMATARPIAGAGVLDAGTGVPEVEEAFRWLLAGHQPGRFRVRSLPDGANQSTSTAAFRREGIATGDTVQRFAVTSVAGQPSAEILLAADASWLVTPARATFRGGPLIIPVRYNPALMREPGLYTGTVWARSASDPMAGALFGLTSTIVIPYDLADGAVRSQHRIAAGREARLYVRLPAGVGGMQVSVRTPAGQGATVSLFEPSGRPQRDGLGLELGGEAVEGAMVVRAEDAVPGVWEIVVVAPPVAAATVAVTVETSAIRIEQSADAAELVNTSTRPATVHLRTQALGAVTTWAVTGHGDPVTRAFVPPPWATDVGVDIALNADAWGMFTDFGATVFDDIGRLLGTEPLNYATGRQVVTLGERQDSVTIELFPALANVESVSRWTASVAVSFLHADRLTALLGNAPDTTFVLEAGGRRRLAAPPLGVPDAMRALFEVRAVVDGVVIVRRVVLPVPRAVPAEAGR